MELYHAVTQPYLVAQNRSKQARLLMNTFTFFFNRIGIDSGIVNLLEPANFASEFRAAKRRHLEDNIAREAKTPPNNRNEQHTSASTRLAKLWREKSPVHVTPAITCENSETAR